MPGEAKLHSPADGFDAVGFHPREVIKWPEREIQVETDASLHNFRCDLSLWGMQTVYSQMRAVTLEDANLKKL